MVLYLRKLMLEHGIYDTEELKDIMGINLMFKHNEISNVFKKQKNFFKIQKEYDNYINIIKKIILVFENYINEHLGVKLEIKKFIMEDLYNA